MTANGEPLALAPGHHLFPGPDGRWVLLTDDERFLAVPGRPQAVAALAEAITAGRPRAAALEQAQDSEEFAALLQTFVTAGFVVTSLTQGHATSPVSARPVLVAGATPVAELLADLLDASVPVRVATALPASDREISGHEALLACAGWLPDRAFSDLDACCEHLGVALHTCHMEGRRLVIGPFAAAAARPRYRDVRLRRLAAADCPDELAAHWCQLDEGTRLPPVPWPDRGACAAAAGAIASDLLAHLRGEPVIGAGCQRLLDPEDWTWSRHPVLPVPDGIMTEVP